MNKRRSLRTHPDLLEKIANPGKFLFNAPFRISAIPMRFSCEYSATSLRKRSASLRRASDLDPGHLRLRSGASCGAPYPIRYGPWPKQAKKAFKNEKKSGK